MTGLVIFLVIAIGLPLYFLPSIIAFRRDHVYKGAITVINLVFGFTGLGWAGSMIWALYPEQRTPSAPVVIKNSNESQDKGSLGRSTNSGGMRNPTDILGNKTSNENKESDAETLTSAIERIVKLKNEGVLTETEFAALKAKILEN